MVQQLTVIFIVYRMRYPEYRYFVWWDGRQQPPPRGPAIHCYFSCVQHSVPGIFGMVGQQAPPRGPAINCYFSCVQHSLPGIFGMVGRPPTATSTWSAVYCLPPTVTWNILT